MLFVGCNCCGQVGPLWCGGTFMPHMPMAIFQSPYGFACPFCGIKQPVFTCMACGTTQMMYQQGQQINPVLMRQMGVRQIAPVVQAQENASPSLLQGLMKEMLTSFAKSAGSSFGDQFGDYAGGYFFGDQSY